MTTALNHWDESGGVGFISQDEGGSNGVAFRESDYFDETLNPLGVAIVIEAHHLCMMMRGVQKQNSSTTTSAFTGQFKIAETRGEFLKLIQ